jgi:hypothetical protein
MNWFNQLLRKPALAGPAPTPPKRPVEPAPDIERLRAALGVAPGPVERTRAAQALGLGLARLGQAPTVEDDPAVRVAAICHVGDKALALQWLAALSDVALLAEVARLGRYAEVRQAAAQRIEDGPTLEELARSAKGRDKGVYRHCAEVLRQRRASAARHEQALRIGAALRTLLDTAPVSVSRLLELEKELNALGTIDPAFAECRALCEQASGRVLEEGRRARVLQAAQQAAATLTAQIDGAHLPDGAACTGWRERLEALRELAGQLPDGTDAPSSPQKLRAQLLHLEGQIESVARDLERAQVCEAFLASADAALPEGPTEQAVTMQAQTWAELALPEHTSMRASLEARWAAQQTARQAPLPTLLPTPLPTPLPTSPAATQDCTGTAAPAARRPGVGAAALDPPQRAQPAQAIDPEALRAQIHDLESAVDEGQLAEADAVAKRIKAATGTATLDRRLDARLQRALARLGELRGWAKWGATKQREQLIEAAQELIGHAAGVDHISVAVPALREAWKQLNVQGPASKGQWEVFDAALEQAYQPVTVQRAAEAQGRAQARAHKEALLDQWERWLATLEAQGAEYPALEAQLGQMLAQWRAAPHAGFRDERMLRKRADALRADIERRLGTARQAELERREQLVAAAQALVQNADLRLATDEVKALQERWRAPQGAARLAHGDEQKLWRQFRAACDAVFARREAQRSEEALRRERHGQVRAQLLERFTAALESTDAGQIKRALAQFASDWHGARPAPTGARAAAGGDGPDRQARALQARAQQRIEELHQTAYRSRLEQWRSQPPQSTGLDESALEQGRQARETLLLDLEIALDLPSPGHQAEARRRRQLEQLQARFRGGVAPKPDAEALLAQWHTIAAAADTQQEQRLTAAVDKLVARNARAG